jgi:site-specific DNA-methyltransferase (adenine-specific)
VAERHPFLPSRCVLGDCLEELGRVDAQSVDLVFADLPYGKTANVWDKQLPMDKLWVALKRVIKPNGVLVFTGIQPFTSLVVCSNIRWFKHAMVWRKNVPSGFMAARTRPLRAHEDVLVFCEGTPRWYTPQMTTGHCPTSAWRRKSHEASANYGGGAREGGGAGGSTIRYPVSVLDIPVVQKRGQKKHPTEKPEELAAWFVRTYTLPGDLVLDPTAGSGSTLCAAVRAGRNAIGFETDADMVSLANERLGCVRG